ncbi:MAG: hypothetical protein PHH93_07315, partial [Prolixibacteraceae bacterium]|nr:hypothetical protein [Prolixibacteraceae bacterium]
IMQLLYLLDSNIEKATSGFFNEKDSIALNGYKEEPADMKPDREKLQTETEEVILSEENGFEEPITEDREITEKGYIGSEEHREEHVTPEVENQNEDEMLGEDTVRTEEHTRLGESFLKGKSVNDLITDQHKLEFKLSNRPVANIKAAIGINDRFQYIRELFDNNPQKFLETVETLDSMDNVHDAVDFIRHNFKWKKSDASLKFANLVKRRFMNK